MQFSYRKTIFAIEILICYTNNCVFLSCFSFLKVFTLISIYGTIEVPRTPPPTLQIPQIIAVYWNSPHRQNKHNNNNNNTNFNILQPHEWILSGGDTKGFLWEFCGILRSSFRKSSGFLSFSFSLWKIVWDPGGVLRNGMGTHLSEIAFRTCPSD